MAGERPALEIEETGVLPREEFFAVLEEMVHSRQANLPALLLLDLVRFDEISAQFGPYRCDDLLKRVSQRLRSAVPEPAVVGQVGRNGFAVLDPGSACVEDCAARLLRVFERPFMVGEWDLHIGVRIGSARTGEGCDTADELYRHAIMAHNRCKKTSGRHVHFDPEMRAAEVDLFRIESDLRRSLLEDDPELLELLHGRRLVPVFQPKLDLASGRVTGVEALARWRDAGGRLISPGLFLPVAEKAGLMDALLLTMVRCTIDALARLPEEITAAVNVSPRQLLRHEWLGQSILALLQDSGVAVGRLELEITEEALGEPIDEAMRALSALGLKIWVDDFGTGEASLARLARLPFAGIKVDKSVVDMMEPETTGAAEKLLGAIQVIAMSLSMATVVEGIETQWQADRVAAHGFDYGQGFWLSKPLEFDALLDFLARDGHLQEPTVPLHSIAFISRNTMQGDFVAELRRIVAISEANNRRHGISGAILCSRSHFAQILEGPVDALNDVFERIAMDGRHDDLQVLFNRPIKRRSFNSHGLASGGIVGDEALMAPVKGMLDETQDSKRDVTGELARNLLTRLLRQRLVA